MSLENKATKLAETSRTYRYADAEIRLDDVVELVVRESGSHRIKTANTPSTTQVLGDILKSARLDKSLTLRDLSAETHVALSYLSDIELGKKEASSQIIGTIAESLEIPLSVLYLKLARTLHEHGE